MPKIKTQTEKRYTMTTATNTETETNTTETVIYDPIVPALPIPNMSKGEARRSTDKIKRHLNDLPMEIHKAHQGKAYLALGYKNVEAWADVEFGMSRSRLYQLSAWQMREIAIKERFGLPDEWTVAEERYRGLNNDAFAAVLNEIQVTLTRAMRDKKPVDLETLAKNVLNAHYTQRENDRKGNALASSNVGKSGDEKSSKTTTTTTTKTIEVIKTVAVSYDLLLVKADSMPEFKAKMIDPEIDNATKAEIARDEARTLLEFAAYFDNLPTVDSVATDDNVDAVESDESTDVNVATDA